VEDGGWQKNRKQWFGEGRPGRGRCHVNWRGGAKVLVLSGRPNAKQHKLVVALRAGESKMRSRQGEKNQMEVTGIGDVPDKRLKPIRKSDRVKREKGRAVNKRENQTRGTGHFRKKKNEATGLGCSSMSKNWRWSSGRWAWPSHCPQNTLRTRQCEVGFWKKMGRTTRGRKTRTSTEARHNN